jgi:hypothetical protein
MQTYESLKYTTWECKYHAVFIPKCRRKVLYQGIRRELGTAFGSLAEQWEIRVEEGHLMLDQVHIPSLRLCRRSLVYNCRISEKFVPSKDTVVILCVFSIQSRIF